MIVSIYLKEHEFLKLETPQTLNFGGKYLYNFEEQGRNLYVTKKLNEKYIPDFFNISGSQCKINLLSAIVGANGVGKSSVLDIIRNIFANSGYNGAFPHNLCVVLVEENGQTKVLYEAGYTNIYIKSDSGETSELEYASKQEYQSIYYSPHFDLKYNPDFDEVDKYDISLDKYIQKDLENIDKKGTNESGWKYPLHEELKFKESMRQIELMQSSIFQNNSVFRDIFNLPEYKIGVLYFRETNIDYDDKGKVNFWNTPMPLQSIIQLILDKIKIEKRDWSIFRDNNLDIEDNRRQALVNKYLLERYVIQCFMTMIINQMEKHNTWLEEGHIPEPYQMERFANHSAKEVFYYFIKESYIQIGNRKKHIFNSEDVIAFIEKLFTLFEKEKNPDKITKQSIWLDLSELKEILELHKEIITNLFHYYPKYERKIDEMDYVEGFLSFYPTDRNMSSGETATLNLFSKLYDFIDMNLVEERPFLSNTKNYILLLDEADLGFHPLWKKKYVNAILKALPYFFENLPLKPNLQIIITTHDPLTLSDLPMNNVVFIQRQGDFLEVVPEENKVQKTFGANITDLLAHSFFVGDGLIGDFAKSKIEDTITWINENKTNQGENFEKELKYYKKVINLIDERVLKLKLTEMITELVPDDDYHNQIIDEEIKKLKRLRK
ncbi:AAA family ATPase [Capnocytophaga stomatis]|uniref:AAA family ATPase n=1 Tax=Capnocytophaga stomatis TaxID=1848904 RepID=UPI001AD1CF1E|nr:AAA family ATPase [Capnocytophaga stomatis]GIM50578.1 hypothetical protein CAPN003_20300 [Capnocytophaga stomatis]